MTNSQIYALFAIMGLLLIFFAIYYVRFNNAIAELADVKEANLKLETSKSKLITFKNNAKQ